MIHFRRAEDRDRTDLGWLDRRRRAAQRYFALLASKDGRNESLPVRQDVDLWMALIDPGETRVLPLRPGRHAWIHVVRGSITVNGSDLAEGDGASMSDEQVFTLIGRDHAEVLLFDLA
jgi:redox-sensitive bicupin YhaK (pirin superfamily)